MGQPDQDLREGLADDLVDIARTRLRYALDVRGGASPNELKLSDLHVALELPSNEAVRSAVEAGDGATAVSDLVAAPSITAKTLHRVKFDLPRRSFYILRHKERHVSRAEDALLKSFR